MALWEFYLKAISFLNSLATLALLLQYIQLMRLCVRSVSWDEWSKSRGRGSWSRRKPRDLRHPERRPPHRVWHNAPSDCLLRTDPARIAPDTLDSTQTINLKPLSRIEDLPNEKWVQDSDMSLRLTVQCWLNLEELLVGSRRKETRSEPLAYNMHLWFYFFFWIATFLYFVFVPRLSPWWTSSRRTHCFLII